MWRCNRRPSWLEKGNTGMFPTWRMTTRSITPPKTDECPLKNSGWKTILFFWNGPFSGDMLIFGGFTCLQGTSSDLYFFTVAEGEHHNIYIYTCCKHLSMNIEDLHWARYAVTMFGLSLEHGEFSNNHLTFAMRVLIGLPLHELNWIELVLSAILQYIHVASCGYSQDTHAHTHLHR